MGRRVKKAVNGNYLIEESPKECCVNEANRQYIDCFVFKNYGRLYAKFNRIASTINSGAFSSTDKLNEILLSLYTDPQLHFTNQNEADEYLSGKFTEKALRIVKKKPVKGESED